MTKHKIALIGSGNWASATGKIMGENILGSPKLQAIFEIGIQMWTYEEMIDGRKITEIINTKHQNVKYLPGIDLPHNLIANPDLVDCTKNATILVFCLPHQFLPRTLSTMKPHVNPKAIGISLIKGMMFEETKLLPITTFITRTIGIPMAVLSGANVADEIAKGQLCETTIGAVDETHVKLFKDLFHTDAFRVSVVKCPPPSIEIYGACKNVVALGAGFVDAFDFGNNTKSAIIRNGAIEILKLIKLLTGCKDDTIALESCGIADLITTCFGGRNRKCAEKWARSRMVGIDLSKDEEAPIDIGMSWEEVEEELLGGQKLQGNLTAEEIYVIIKREHLEKEFPLLTMICRISEGSEPVTSILKF
ncbi:Glycerol-3-phosphate dehydrogenase [NAD(+)], cytoplasmic [Aduncisulcus paluster]|uniref:Glycerol-3-phosphate dehydrogenase [NAD(+)] n=1 Tax=Aduncisulcus paluster TaxID=2918883 RepID=A0ABQ5KWM4_9EUKA|nr:Glycerol-3-phosphate dehydrogenase [NAD(+)], cytoplasmic [Aduncisulcus paluster]|eukprot:gnl/Carplike_NY0171/977_a1343_1300.p1 GENE.gnl/Carplike_NY0171/977_a1343_1300~~gnl/Carplike_NY0171/977_a1343_1300.p1  ORF type:complete len:363 (-),score=73.30 gnl/Carplike_NY0171/977_a1343_1300:202-1290(-)